MHRRLTRGRAILLLGMAALLVFALAAPAYATLAARGPAKTTAPGKGFPLWYQDQAGTALELNVGPINSFFDPVVLSNPVSVDAGFGAEAFYWDASALINLPGVGNKADIRMALEASWAGGAPLAGDQAVFQRLRIRIDAPVAGLYTVTHPFGVEVFNVTTPGTRAINMTNDVGLVAQQFDLALTGLYSIFLASTSAPAGFLGDAATATTVTGSPVGTNFFRIEGPAGADLDGLGNNVVETDLFTVQGKIYQGTAFSIEQATYGRTAGSGHVDVWAVSTTAAALDVSWPGVGPIAMTSNGAGRFFASVPLPDPAILPALVTVTGDRGTANESSLDSLIQDVVTVAQATFDTGTGDLTIHAVSSDELSGGPVLTATGFGALTAGNLVVGGVTVPPTSVSVVSSAGGSHTEPLVVVTTVVYPLSGTITDVLGGAPVPGVTVAITLNGAPAGSAVTDTNGAYSINVADGSYVVTPSQAGRTFTPASRNVTVAGAAQTGVDFARNAPPNVGEPVVVSPNTGGTFAQGSPVTVEWNVAAPPTDGLFHVYAYAADGTYYWLNTQPGQAGKSAFSYNWTVAQPVGTGYVIRVWYVDAVGNWLYMDASDAPFDITAGAFPQPTVTAPNSGASVATGSEVPIQWTLANPAAGLLHAYAYAADGTYYWLTTQVASAGQSTYDYNWTVAQPVGTGYVIRVWYVDGVGNWLTLGDSSPAFDITPGP